MNIIPYLTALWPGFGEVLLEGTGGETVTLGGLLVVLAWLVLGGLLAAYSSAVVVLYERARGIEDEQFLALSRHAIRLVVLLSCLLIGLDMGGVVSVETSVGTTYDNLSRILSVVLFTRSEVPITVGGLVTVAIWLLIGRSLSRRVSALVLRLVREREVDDERVLRLVKQVSEAVVVLACLGIGLDMGSLASIDRSVSGFFSLFTSEMFVIGEHGITITTLLTVAAIVVGSFYVSRLSRATMRPALELRLSTPEDQGTVSVIERLAHYIIVAIGFIIALQTAGINLSALLATGAAFAVGLSLAMQNMAQNFISGLILLLERAIKPGDILELDGEPVRVIKIGIRSTVVKTLNDEDRIVPNSSLVDNAITNFSYADQNLRIRAGVGVSYDSDLNQVLKSLSRAAENVPHLPEFPPRIQLLGFGSSSVDFEVSIWIRDPWKLHQVASDLRLAIWWALKEDEVTISYPQLDIHFDKDEPPPLTLVSRDGD